MFKPLMQPLLQKREAAAGGGQHSGSSPEIRIAELVWDGGRVVLECPEIVFALYAGQYNHIVVNRRRWISLPEAVERQSADAVDFLWALNAHPQLLIGIADAGLVEVVIDSASDPEGRIRGFPWEFVVAAATRRYRQGRPLTVARRLSPEREAVKVAKDAPVRALYVESAPGRLAGLYSFESERALVKGALPDCDWKEVLNPTRERLREEIAAHTPLIIHLAGFDSHQGGRLAGLPDEAADGYLLTGKGGNPDPVDGTTLADLLLPGTHRPLLISCSTWNSGRAVAPALVQRGAGAALGFQDSFDDAMAESFFAGFYRSCKSNDWDLAASFVDAWTAIRSASPSLLGSGVTLWGSTPLVRDESVRAMKRAKERAGTRGTGTGSGFISLSGTGDGGGDELDPDKLGPAGIASALLVEIIPEAELNYSLLHNDGDLFKKFQISRQDETKKGPIRGLTIKVELYCGTQGLPFITTRELGEKPIVTDLNPLIHATLTSSLIRSSHEAVNTSLFVEVTWKNHLLWRNTERVRLLPADQWRDSDKDRQWLPSFVFPRDRAITKLVEEAQRYVRVLRDDPAAGFDGYQSLDEEREDPSEEVDLQAQAIWSTLLHDWRLGYINPPPTYGRSDDWQRVRPPSAILRDRAGTCIDLALLFASALELVDIYPVIFLLQGHAFPGYWRSDRAHTEFVEAKGGGSREAAGSRQAGWMVSSYAEVTHYVNSGHLVPIETVGLTSQTGFWEAMELGRENLASKEEFHSMVDIIRARREPGRPVTPLPILEES
jgi:hypothetical protein